MNVDAHEKREALKEAPPIEVNEENEGLRGKS